MNTTQQTETQVKELEFLEKRIPYLQDAIFELTNSKEYSGLARWTQINIDQKELKQHKTRLEALKREIAYTSIGCDCPTQPYEDAEMTQAALGREGCY